MNTEKSELDIFEAAFDFGDDSKPSDRLETFHTNASLNDGDLSELLKILGDEQTDEFETSKKPETQRIKIPQKTNFSELPPKRVVKKENVIYITEKPISEESKSAHRKVIDGIEIAVSNAATEKKQEEQEQVRKKQRKYTNSADMEKIIFHKPKSEVSFLPKFIMFICICTAVGIALGLQSNSYYNYVTSIGKKIDSTMSCLWLWLLEESMPFNPFPLNSSVFGMGFAVGFFIIAIIGLFIWLDNDAKKQSRVGHEHGNARLGTPKDFKNFKNRFMEK